MADPAAALELAQSPAGRGDACFRRRTVGAPTGAPSHRTEQFHSDFDGDHEPSPTERLEPRRRHPRELRVTGKAGVAPRAGYVRIQTDSGHVRDLDLRYVAAHLEHAYAVTGHGAQGATVSWAGVIGRSEEFTREWAYTALSRARDQTVLHVISERRQDERDREDYGPPVDDRDRGETLRALDAAMKHSETERLAVEQGQPESEFQRRLVEANDARQRELERLAELDVRAALSRPRQPPFRGPLSRWSAHRGQERERGLER